jgi:hypothetical protein
MQIDDIISKGTWRMDNIDLMTSSSSPSSTSSSSSSSIDDNGPAGEK